VNCPSCGAPMRLEADRNYLLCDYCGSVYFPEPNADGVRVLGGSSPLGCPTCDIPLVHASVGDQRMLYCTRCRGMLIPMDVFVTIVQDLRSRREASVDAVRQPDWREMDRRLRCPQCNQVMETHPYGGGGNVILEDCERCSLNWLDYGELDKIVRAPDHDYLDEASDLSDARRR
jgi:Zn-finger nucleic acid-binding protein